MLMLKDKPPGVKQREKERNGGGDTGVEEAEGRLQCKWGTEAGLAAEESLSGDTPQSHSSSPHHAATLVPYSTPLYCTLMYNTPLLHPDVQHPTVLYCTVLHCTVLIIRCVCPTGGRGSPGAGGKYAPPPLFRPSVQLLADQTAAAQAFTQIATFHPEVLGSLAADDLDVSRDHVCYCHMLCCHICYCHMFCATCAVGTYATAGSPLGHCVSHGWLGVVGGITPALCCLFSFFRFLFCFSRFACRGCRSTPLFDTFIIHVNMLYPLKTIRLGS